MSTSSTTSTSTFNGTSTFSTDLQNVLTRAVSIASLPITQLQNQQSKLTTQQTGLQTLGTLFTSLQTALTSMDTSVASGSLAATVDATSVAHAAISTGALAGTYSVNISSLGSQTNTVSNSSLPSVTDPSSSSISTSNAFTLTVDGKAFTLNPAGNNLNSLVSAINTSGANVQATIVNVGGSTSPDYRLSIQGTQYSPTTVQLNDGTQDLLTNLSTGSYVTYQVNGQPSTPANSTTRALSISTGLTVTALQTGTANVTVAQVSSGIQSTLTSFITAYNSTVDELTKSRGQNGGALTGQSIVSQLSDKLRSLTGFSSTSSGTVQNLADLGVTFDQNGHLQLDTDAFAAATSSSLADATAFLGSVSGKSGFLGAASDILSSVTDSTSGLITTASNSLGTSILNLTTKISSEQDRVTQLQTNLTAQMAQADAAIAALQQQATQLTNLFAAQEQAAKNITG